MNEKTFSTFPVSFAFANKILHFARREKHTMNSRNALSLRVVAIAFGMIVAFGIPTFGQEAPLQQEASAPKSAPVMNEVLRHNIEDWALQGRGIPSDWSNHHLVFSNPGAEEDAIANGTHDRWLSIVNDPRYILQQMKRSSGVKTFADPETASLGQAKTESINKAKPKKGKTKEGMWTETLLAHGQVQPNMYPAKFSFSTTVANCSTDFVAYPTGVAGAAGVAANIIAYNELYGTNTPTETGCGSTTVTVPSVYWAYNTGGMVTTSPIISADGSQVAFIQSNFTTQSLTGCIVGYAGFPFFELIDLTCTGGGFTSADVGAVVSGTNIPAGDTIATVTSSTTATLTTAATGTPISASLTLTGVPTNTASLVLLKWAPSTTQTLSMPDNLTPQTSASNYRSCTAPCYYAVSLGANDTYSAPFYDYGADDAMYVGDDIGRLHKITGVFYGTIGEATGWPATLPAAHPTAPPVYDPTSGYVFVGNITTGTTAALYAVDSASPTTIRTSSSLGDAIVDGTLVDPNTEKVYAFVTTSGGNNTVYQFAALFTSGTAGASVPTGFGGTGYYFYSGTFDNVYYASTTGPAGDLWVAGNTGGSTGGNGGGVNLYRIPIGTGSAMGTPVAAITGLTDTSTGHYGWPSPITEFCNNGTSDCTANGTQTTAGKDYIFFSVDRLHAAIGTCGTGAGDGCVLGYNITVPGTTPPTAVGGSPVSTTGTPGCWSTSAIEIDNSVPATGTGSLAGASQIYTLEFNGNTAGGPYEGTYSSSNCNMTNPDPSSPIALQLSQSALD
jgi:hypothetical protein